MREGANFPAPAAWSEWLRAYTQGVASGSRSASSER